MTDNYDKKLSKTITTRLQINYKWCSLILAEVLTASRQFFKNALHYRWSPCNFPSFSEFLGSSLEGSLYKALWLHAIIATYALIYIFIKTHWWERSLQIWSKTNSFAKSSRMKLMGCLLLTLKDTQLPVRTVFRSSNSRITKTKCINIL